MEDIINSKINDVNSFIEKGEYVSAIKVLHDLAQEFPDETIIPYHLGRIAMLVKDNDAAMKYFSIAMEKGHSTAELHLSIGILCCDNGDIADAEKNFIEAGMLANTVEAKWTTSSVLAIFYLENEMYLKAEKIAKKMTIEYPDNYQGYHLHIMAETARGHLEEVNAYMDKLPNQFKSHPQYLMDIIDILKIQKKTDELLKLFDEDGRFNDIIPQVVLREKINAMPNDEYSDEKERLVYRLAKNYHDSDAVVSTMIIEFGKRNFKKSSKIANVILDNEKRHPSLKYYLALYFQIFNLYYLADKKPSEKLSKWIESAGNWCVEFTDSLSIPEIGDTVKNSIQELFEEINSGVAE